MKLNDDALRLFGLMEAVNDLKLFGEPLRLSKTESRLLKEVLTERANGRDIISSELSRRLGVTRSAVSQLVTKLEESGILARTAAPDDKKIAYIRLSDRALAEFNERCVEINALLDRCTEKFGKERLQRLSVDSADFIALMKEERGKNAEEEK